MSRPKTINYRRVTFSFPADLLDTLRLKIEQNKMSNYIVDLVKKDLSIKEQLKEDGKKLIESLKAFRKENEAFIKDKRSSIEIIREMRYHGKY